MCRINFNPVQKNLIFRDSPSSHWCTQSWQCVPTSFFHLNSSLGISLGLQFPWETGVLPSLPSATTMVFLLREPYDLSLSLLHQASLHPPHTILWNFLCSYSHHLALLLLHTARVITRSFRLCLARWACHPPSTALKSISSLVSLVQISSVSAAAEPLLIPELLIQQAWRGIREFVTRSLRNSHSGGFPGTLLCCPGTWFGSRPHALWSRPAEVHGPGFQSKEHHVIGMDTETQESNQSYVVLWH